MTTTSLETLDALRRVPGSWLQVICNSRTPGGELAWSVTVKLGPHSVQYVHTSLDEALRSVRAFFEDRGIDPFEPPKRKLKLKRSTT
jgi:hypothetical protein